MEKEIRAEETRRLMQLNKDDNSSPSQSAPK
jgi:hypothetical protein